MSFEAQLDWYALLSCLSKAVRLWLFVSISVFFIFTPGLWLCQRYKDLFNSYDRLAVSLIVASALGYLLFWAYFASPALGKVLSCGLMVGCLFVARKSWAAGESKRTAVCVGLVAVYFLSLAQGVLPDKSTSFATSNVTRWTLPHDHVIPFMFSSRMARGEDFRDMGFTWRSSDRPPLQAGLTLITQPLFSAMALESEGYHAGGSVLQASWVIALFLLCGAWGLNRRQRGVVGGLCLFSWFFFINTVYVWPKFLAGALSVIATVFITGRNPSAKYFMLAGAAFGFSALSHGSVLFTMLPLVAGCLFIRRHPGWMTRLILVVSLCGALYVPWVLYQKLYDPPGNRLIKYHFAGVADPDPRGVLETLRDSFGAIPWSDYWQGRRINLLNPFQGYVWESAPNIYAIADTLRSSGFFYLGPTIGLLWVGLLLMIVPWNKARSTAPLSAQQWRWVGYLVFVHILWSVSLFTPKSTVLHQGSYVVPLVWTALMAALVVLRAHALSWLILGQRIVTFTIALVVAKQTYTLTSLVFGCSAAIALTAMIRQQFFNGSNQGP